MLGWKFYPKTLPDVSRLRLDRSREQCGEKNHGGRRVRCSLKQAGWAAENRERRGLMSAERLIRTEWERRANCQKREQSVQWARGPERICS